MILEKKRIEIFSIVSVETMEFTDPNYLVKAPKKERSEAQKAATAKAFAALKAKREAINEVVAEVKPDLVKKKSSAKVQPMVKEEEAEVTLTKPIKEEKKEEKVVAPTPAPASLNEEELYTKFAQRMKAEMSDKKPKKKVVIVEEDSSSEDEVVVRRKKPAPVKEVVEAAPVVKTTGSRVLDKLLFTKF